MAGSDGKRRIDMRLIATVSIQDACGRDRDKSAWSHAPLNHSFREHGRPEIA